MSFPPFPLPSALPFSVRSFLPLPFQEHSPPSRCPHCCPRSSPSCSPRRSPNSLFQPFLPHRDLSSILHLPTPPLFLPPQIYPRSLSLSLSLSLSPATANTAFATPVAGLLTKAIHPSLSTPTILALTEMKLPRGRSPSSTAALSPTFLPIYFSRPSRTHAAPEEADGPPPHPTYLVHRWRG